MSRLDEHLRTALGRLMLGTFVQALGWTLWVAAGALLAAVLIYKLFAVAPVRLPFLIAGLILAAVAIAAVWAIRRRPAMPTVALAIDQALGTKEKFSTAVAVRASGDGFAQAAVSDAEATARNVTLAGQFRPAFPRPLYYALATGLLALVLVWMVPPLDLLHRQAQQQQVAQQAAQAQQAQSIVKKALAEVMAQPKAVADSESVKLAKANLENLLNKGLNDPNEARRSVAKAMEDLNKALAEQVKANQRFAAAHNTGRLMQSLKTPADSGAVADAQRAMAKGDNAGAQEALHKTAEQFASMSQEQKEAAARQAQQLAADLKAMAEDPAMRQKLQEQLQAAGASEAQAQKMLDDMRQAAGGDQAAAQRVAEQVEQMLAQANNGQGATEQQKQQIREMIHQVEAQVGAQQQAGAMAEAMQQFADQLQRACNGEGGQKLADGANAVCQKLGQLNATQAEAAGYAKAQEAARQAADGAAASVGQGEGQGISGESGSSSAGNSQGGGIGSARVERSMGEGSDKTETDVGFSPHRSTSQIDPTGRILASWYVKADPLKGQSTVPLRDVAAAALAEAPDEVDAERIGLQSQKVVRDYFRSMQDEQR